MMDLLSAGIIICVIILLICLSAFFSSAETALTAASDARMRQLARKGRKRAQIVEKLRKNRERLIGALCQCWLHSAGETDARSQHTLLRFWTCFQIDIFVHRHR